MSENIDLAATTEEFVMTPEQLASVEAYNKKKAEKLAAKGLTEAPRMRSELVIKFVMNSTSVDSELLADIVLSIAFLLFPPVYSVKSNVYVLSDLIRKKGDSPIPEDLQTKADDALVAYIKKHVNERKRYSRITWKEGHGVTPGYGGALREITLSGSMDNEYSSDDFLDRDVYAAWKRNPTGEPTDEDEDDDEDDYDEDDEEEEDDDEEEEEESDDEAETDPAKIALAYAEATDAAIAKFAEYSESTFAEVKKTDEEADEKPGRAYYNLHHIPKVVSITLVKMSTV